MAARTDVASCSLGNGSALLDLRTNVYFSMNPVASVIWANIQAPAALSDIYEAVEARFKTPGNAFTEDVQNLLSRLIELDLIELRGESSVAE